MNASMKPELRGFFPIFSHPMNGQFSKRRPIAHKNRFEIPSDSEDDEEEQRGPAIAKPRDLTGAWAKGAPKEKEEAPKESKQMTAEEAEAEFAKLAAKMKPIESWADACSDDED